MRKFIFYTIWSCNKLEEYLENMESKGYRVVGLYLGYWFDFVESKPKYVRYFYSTSFLKDCEMLQDEHQIRQEFSADPIPAIGFGSTHIHRITHADVNINDLRKNRIKVFRKITLKKTIAFIIASIGCVCGHFLYEKVYCFFWASSVLFICLSLFHMYGLFLLCNDNTDNCK